MRALAPAALLLAITAGFYWKLTLTDQFSWLENPEAAYRTMPSLDLEARELRTRRFTLWDNQQWGGESLLARAGLGAANPLLLPLFAMPLRDGHVRLAAWHWWWVLLHWLAALAAYRMCREVGARRGGAMLGASVFALGGFLGAAQSPQAISAALSIPVVLWAMLRVLGGRRVAGSAAAGGAALGLAFLSGNYEVPLLLALAAAGLWIFALASGGTRRGELARGAALFLAIALLVSAVDLVPRIAYGWTAGRASLGYHPLAANAASPRTLLGMIVPGWSTGANPFLGAIAMLLAAAGLATGWARRPVKVLATVAVLATAVAIPIAQAALAGLIALGFDGWPEWRGSRVARWILAGFAMAVLAVYLVLGVARMRPAEERPAAAALAALLGAFALTAWDRGGISRRGAAAALLGLALVEVGTVSSLAIPETNRPETPLRMLRDHADLAFHLRTLPGWFRIDADPKDVPYNFGEWFGVEQAGGATTASTARVARLAPEERQRLFGMRYYLGRTPSHPDQVSLFEGASGIKVFRDARKWSPVWTEPEGGTCAGPDEVRVESRRSTGTVLIAGMHCPGTVVVGDVHAPGWRAFIDGRRVPIREMHGVVRGVAAPAGRHRIEIVYRPWALYAGAGLTLAGLLLACALVRR